MPLRVAAYFWRTEPRGARSETLAGEPDRLHHGTGVLWSSGTHQTGRGTKTYLAMFSIASYPPADHFLFARQDRNNLFVPPRMQQALQQQGTARAGVLSVSWLGLAAKDTHVCTYSTCIVYIKSIYI